MSIIKVDLSSGGWTAISNKAAADARLSLDTRGLMVWLLTRPQGWQVRATLLPSMIRDDSTKSGHLGREAIRRMLRQLEAAGYLTRRCFRDERGHWTWENVLRPMPDAVAQKAVDGAAVDGATEDGKPVDKNKTQNKTKQVQLKKNQTIDAVTDRSVNETGLIYRPPFVDEHLPSARKLIGLCPPKSRQLVLDEVYAIYQLGKLRGSPCGLLRRLIERARDGSFRPTYGSRMSRGVGVAQNAAPASFDDARKKLATSTPVKVSGVAESILAEIRRNLQRNN